MLARFNAFTDEPGSSHTKVGEHMGAVFEDEIEHLAFAIDPSDGEVHNRQLGVEDVLFELRGCGEGDYLEREIVGELGADGFDFG